MKILTLRTDRPEAELGLFEDDKKLAYNKWQADRQLAKNLNLEIKKILNKSSITIKNLEGIVVFKGPGSFTGLRIGIATANALAYSLNVPIVSADGNDWLQKGIKKITAGENEKIALPKYDRPAATTTPRK